MDLATESSPRGTLILGWGNPGRRDDGLGPALAAAIGADPPAGVTVETGYQLQVENAVDIARHGRVLFVDADRSCVAPYSIRRLEPDGKRRSFSTHSLAPEAILALAHDLFGAAPEAWILGIRGYEFDAFGEGLSDRARGHLAAAVGFVRAACSGAGFGGCRQEESSPKSLESETDS